MALYSGSGSVRRTGHAIPSGFMAGGARIVVGISTPYLFFHEKVAPSD